jgi:hypothetical protein
LKKDVITERFKESRLIKSYLVSPPAIAPMFLPLENHKLQEARQLCRSSPARMGLRVVNFRPPFGAARGLVGWAWLLFPETLLRDRQLQGLSMARPRRANRAALQVSQLLLGSLGGASVRFWPGRPVGPHCPSTEPALVQATRPRACLQCANTPDVPFCAAPTTATAVVLARRSVLGGGA